MPRISLVNFAIGFWTLFIAAASGAFIATDLTASYVAEQAINPTWNTVLLSSAHGHTNLFGLLHIAFGLTLPYSRLGPRWQVLQSAGLSCGILAMGPGMFIRSLYPPVADGTDSIGLVLGLLLSAALATLFSHAAALTSRCIARK
ncbi:MAG: hypothetical protein FJ146_00935 [Deltaproteobacteria bacterium]|nr:hypothetical protein [Deltaproteobacteria bacterium]